MQSAKSPFSNRLVDFVTRYSPWLAPVPTATAIYTAGVEHLAWPWWAALAAALLIEGLGMATAELALDMYSHNRTRAAGDPAAPTWMASTTLLIYLLAAVLLAVLVDAIPNLVRWVTAVLPLVGLTGYITLALRKDHDRRLQRSESRQALDLDYEQQRRALSLEDERRRQEMALQIEQAERTAKIDLERAEHTARLESEKLDAEAKRQARLLRIQAKLERRGDVSPTPGIPSPNVTPSADPDTRREALHKALQANVSLTITEAANTFRVSRATIYNDLNRLEQAGRIRKNGHGLEVLG